MPKKGIHLGFNNTVKILSISNILHNLISNIKLFNVNHIIKSYVNT